MNYYASKMRPPIFQCFSTKMNALNQEKLKKSKLCWPFHGQLLLNLCWVQRRQISSWILMYQIIHMHCKTHKSLNPLSVLYGWNLCSLLFFTTLSLMTDGKAQTTKLAGRLSWKPLFDDRNFQDYIDYTKFLFFKNKTINLASLLI